MSDRPFFSHKLDGKRREAAWRPANLPVCMVHDNCPYRPTRMVLIEGVSEPVWTCEAGFKLVQEKCIVHEAQEIALQPLPLRSSEWMRDHTMDNWVPEDSQRKQRRADSRLETALQEDRSAKADSILMDMQIFGDPESLPKVTISGVGGAVTYLLYDEKWLILPPDKSKLQVNYAVIGEYDAETGKVTPIH